MTFRRVLITGVAATLLAWGSALAQQPSATQSTPANTATTENPSDSSSSADMKASSKQKHWSGSLVDISCMAKALGSKNGNEPGGAGPNGGTPDAGAPHFMGSADAAQAGQQPGGAIPPGAGAGAPGTQPPGTAPTYPGQPSGPTGMTPDQAAQMARASKIDDAAKQCVPGSSTQVFGLAMSGGQIVKFDNSGNAKAQEALRDIEVQPGKKVKAKVTGTMEDNTTVRVASVEVKGKRGTGNQPASSPGGGQ